VPASALSTAGTASGPVFVSVSPHLLRPHGQAGKATPWFPSSPFPAPTIRGHFFISTLHRDKPEEAVIRLSGELDRVTAPALASCLSELLRGEPRCATLVVDLAETTFLDVGGLNLLLDAHDAVC
jgi:STAS domain